MWFLCAANVTRILLYENAGIPHFIPSVAPGAAFRMHARISRSFFRASFGAASMYSVTPVGLDFFAVMVFYSIDTPVPTPSLSLRAGCHLRAHPLQSRVIQSLLWVSSSKIPIFLAELLCFAEPASLSKRSSTTWRAEKHSKTFWKDFPPSPVNRPSPRSKKQNTSCSRALKCAF